MSWLPRWLFPRAFSLASPSTLVYSRQGCPLCDEAVEVLIRHGLHPEVIDIDQDPHLRERYTDCVPVVVLDGKERFRGKVNEVLLRRLLHRGNTGR